MLRKPHRISNLHALLLCGVTLGSVSTLLLARTITVDDNGPAEFSSIQAAINAAVAGDLVSVAAGTYNENLILKSGVSVVGAGRTVTFVDGGRRGSVAQLVDCDSSTRVSGLTLRNGSAEFGAGLFISGGAPVITLNRVTGNTAVGAPNGLYYYYGGGLEVYFSDAVITDNDIDNNSANIGGGLELRGGAPIVTLNRITGNSSGPSNAYYTFGGGVEVYFTDATIADNTITSNTAVNGAGIDIFLGGPQVLRNQLSLNVAGFWGGGISADLDPGTTARISRNRVENNQSRFGGGMGFVGPGNPLVSNNLIIGNKAIRGQGEDSLGGGIELDYANASLINNTILNNEADFGGGVRIRTLRGPAALTNNILTGNIARAAGTQSGGALLDGGGLQVYNNIFFQNIPGACGGGSALLCTGGDNTLDDPLFVDAGNGDYRLRAGSLAIDSALDSVAPRDDIRGQRRPLDGNRNGEAIADRGAYEFDRNDVFNLRFMNASTMTWDAALGATQYHFYSGGIASLGIEGVGTCRDSDDPNRSDLLFTEALSPSPGSGFVYVVTAVVGTEQTGGWNSLGLERILPAPCP